MLQTIPIFDSPEKESENYGDLGLNTKKQSGEF
jgi:hypothetical protein